MDLKDKIEFVLGQIRESARLQITAEIQQVSFYVESFRFFPAGAVYYEEAITISEEELTVILEKFNRDGLIKNFWVWDDLAFFDIGTLDVDSDDNPYRNSKSGTLLTKSVTQTTDLEKGILALANGQVVHISGQTGNENNPLRLLKTLSKNFDKEWAEDEILEDWEGVVADRVNVPKDRIYQAYVNLRKKVESQTGIQDLIGYRNKTYRLNKKYF